MNVATIGFTKTNAAGFFNRLKRSGVKRVIDVRLHNTSQLAGFAKADDLAYFLSEICGIDYVHEPLLAPTDDILKEFKRDKGDWLVYQAAFRKLLAARSVETQISPDFIQRSCLLCSEAAPHHCHRRLICEYLDEKWGGRLKITHL